MPSDVSYSSRRHSASLKSVSAFIPHTLNCESDPRDGKGGRSFHLDLPVSSPKSKLRKFVVLDIHGGSHRRHEWQCSQIVSQIHQDTNGDSQASGSLTYRDIRQVFADAHKTPSIEVRRHCIVVCLPPVTAILLYNRVYLLLNDDLKLDSLVRSLQQISSSCSSSDSISTDDGGNESESRKGPFEFNALEALIGAAFDELNNDIILLETALGSMEKRVSRTNSTTQDLDNLHNVKGPIQQYIDRVKAFDKTLEKLLASPEDIAQMQLTKYRRMGVDSIHRTDPTDMTNPDLENLLEYFDQEVDQFTIRVSHLQQATDNMERLISLRLALARNKIINLDLGVTIVTCGLTMGTVLSGIFGMNLNSGLESSYAAFVIVCMAIVVFVIASAAVVGVVWWKLKL